MSVDTAVIRLQQQQPQVDVAKILELQEKLIDSLTSAHTVHSQQQSFFQEEQKELSKMNREKENDFKKSLQVLPFSFFGLETWLRKLFSLKPGDLDTEQNTI